MHLLKLPTTLFKAGQKHNISNIHLYVATNELRNYTYLFSNIGALNALTIGLTTSRETGRVINQNCCLCYRTTKLTKLKNINITILSIFLQRGKSGSHLKKVKFISFHNPSFKEKMRLKHLESYNTSQQIVCITESNNDSFSNAKKYNVKTEVMLMNLSVPHVWKIMNNCSELHNYSKLQKVIKFNGPMELSRAFDFSKPCFKSNRIKQITCNIFLFTCFPNQFLQLSLILILLFDLELMFHNSRITFLHKFVIPLIFNTTGLQMDVCRWKYALMKKNMILKEYFYDIDRFLVTNPLYQPHCSRIWTVSPISRCKPYGLSPCQLSPHVCYCISVIGSDWILIPLIVIIFILINELNAFQTNGKILFYTFIIMSKKKKKKSFKGRLTNLENFNMMYIIFGSLPFTLVKSATLSPIPYIYSVFIYRTDNK
ncbi:hypothetical protein AGLY_004434 [Aphis glycines]|uniref:Uncharacterized protein n=1 Tax=Aphis glycines TaxID=307491 RepID=A0A6G0TY18_APHGL|nr:hypothetical protein AGLY_004434 [Aphis glycines]